MVRRFQPVTGVVRVVVARARVHDVLVLLVLVIVLTLAPALVLSWPCSRRVARRAALVAAVRAASGAAFRAFGVGRVVSRAALVAAAGVRRASPVVVAVGGSRAAPIARPASIIIYLLWSCIAVVSSRQIGVRTNASIPLAGVAQIAVTPVAVIQAARRPQPGQFNQALPRACRTGLGRTGLPGGNSRSRHAGAQHDTTRENPRTALTPASKSSARSNKGARTQSMSVARLGQAPVAT